MCHNVQTEPHLIPLEGDTLDLRSINASEEARLDIKVTGFWHHGQTAFIDVTVMHVGSASYRSNTPDNIFIK